MNIKYENKVSLKLNNKLITIFALIITAVSLIIITTTVKLQTAIDEKTKGYVSDVSSQVTAYVDDRLLNITKDLEMVEDSISRISFEEDKDELKAYMNRKAELLNFNSLIVTDRSGNYFSTDGAEIDIINLTGVVDSFNGREGVSFLDGQSLLYSVPIYHEGIIAGVLGGVIYKESMQNILKTNCFEGNSVICITDCDGNVIISPTDLEPFMALEDIFKSKSDLDVVRDVEHMQTNMREHIDGTITFTTVKNDDVVMAYNSLNTNDWVVLTLVKADILSHDTNTYISYMFILVAVVTAIFIFIIILLLYYNRLNHKILEDLAFTDFLTGEMNNLAFNFRCAEIIKNAPENSYSIVHLNIKNFKLINERYGSSEGDKTLKYVMGVLKKNIYADELAARSEMDHFSLCLHENNKCLIENRLDYILKDINSFNNSEKESYNIEFLIGVYIVNDKTMDMTLIHDRAKTACRNSTDENEGKCVFYDDSFMEKLRKEYEMSSAFSDALACDEFRIFLQPKVRLDSRRTESAEALVRWYNKERGFIPPDEFIPIFEKNGYIIKLDIYVFEKVCELLETWIKKDIKIKVAVNLSRLHFKNPEFLSELKSIADSYNIPDGYIELEITESIFLYENDIKFIKEQIDEMHQMGFLCSLDDFGAGFSSLGLLKEFNIDTIKIDRSFFMGKKSERSEIILSCITELALRLGIDTVAEGIETEEQIEFLKKINCRMVQGYYFSKPMPIDEFEKWAKIG